MCYVSLLFWLPLLLRLSTLIHYPDSALDQSPRPSCHGTFQCIWTTSLLPSLQRCYCVIDKCVQCAAHSMAAEALTRKMLHCLFSMSPTNKETAQAVAHKNIIHLGRPSPGWLPPILHTLALAMISETAVQWGIKRCSHRAEIGLWNLASKICFVTLFTRWF